MASLRRGPVLPALAVLAVGAFAGMRAFVASPGSMTSARHSQPSSSAVALRARGGGEYDVSDADIEKFYQDTISGGGGAPPRKGLIEEFVVKFFMGDFIEKPDGKVDFQRASKYTGPAGKVGPKDAAAALENLKAQMKLGKYIVKGGPGNDEAQKVLDDGKGWVWLAADMTPGGLGLALYRSVPYGKRPLLVAKSGDVDGMFAKANWDTALARIEKTMGGPEIKQR